MDTPAPDDFWNLVAASRLVDAGVVVDLQREYASGLAANPGQPAATLAIAQWLVARGVLTLWQARRLARGDRGPYFIGDYRLLARLSAAGAGGLFRARHEPSGRVVQVVVLKTALCRQLAAWTAIVRRTTIAHQALDPLLSRTWALEQAGSNRFIVCEDIPTATLADELAASGPLPAATAGAVVLDLARAVAELHRLGEVHGAISLDTLRRTPASAGAEPRTGAVRLAQFPLAGDPHQEFPRVPAEQPEALEALGRQAAFVAPELMLPGRVCDTRSDVYAIGCVFHALVTGSPPCWQGDAQRTLAQAAFVGVPALAPPVVPVEIATLIGYLTARDPAGRYPSAVEAADAIAACLGRPPVSPSLPAQRPMAVPPAATAAPASAIQATAPSTGSAAAPQPFADPSATFPEISSRTTAAPAIRPLPTRRRRIPLTAAVFAIAAVALAGGGWFFLRPAARGPQADLGGPPPRQEEIAVADGLSAARMAAPAEVPAPPVEAEEEPAASPPTAAPEAMATARQPAARQTLVDDESLPWGSPTEGLPPTLAYLPPGSQIILLVRPAEIAANDDGRLFIKALGPQAEAALAATTKLCGCGIDGIEMIQAGWQAALDGGAVGGYAIHLREPADPATIAAGAGAGKSMEVDGETVHDAATFSWWQPTAAAGRVIVVGGPDVVREIIAAEQDAADRSPDELRATLTPDMERLVARLDRDRHLTLVGAPHYLLNDGRGVLSGPLAKLLDPLEDFFGESLKAAALSMHFADAFYAELDAVATVDMPAARLADTLGTRITDLADTVEEYCSRLDLHPYGRKLVMRLPAMIRIVADATRVGAEDKTVVVNCYLPRYAGHNLALATELALQQTPGSGGPSPAAATAAASATTAAAALTKKMTLTFAKDTLEKSIQMIADEIGMPMEILGPDLQLEGITKNQSFGLEERDKTADEILRVILLKANPDGKLVYVIRKQDGGERIDITTKAAVAKRGDTLPPGFEPASDSEKPSKKK